MLKKVLLMAGAMVFVLVVYLLYEQMFQFEGAEEGMAPESALRQEPSSTHGPVAAPAAASAPGGAAGLAKRSNWELHFRKERIDIYADELVQPEDGRVFLKEFRCDLFTEEGEKVHVESDRAQLRFRRKLALDQHEDLGRPTYAHLEGNVKVTADRATPHDPADDLHVSGDVLFYSEEKHLLWSDGPVHLEDGRHTIHGQHLEADVAESVPVKDLRTGKSTPRRLEVHRVRLERDVEMQLSLESPSRAGPARLGLTASASRPTPEAASAVRVTVRSEGPFVFEPARQVAVFDRNVQVRRVDPARGDSDAMTVACERLHLRFHPLPQASPAPGGPPAATSPTPGSQAPRLQLEEATARGPHVVVVMRDTRGVGTEFKYRPDTDSGELKGDPQAAVYQGPHVIRAAHLVFDRARNEAQALGAGLLQRTSDTSPEPPLWGRWAQRAVFHRTDQGDRLVLTGDVELRQDQRGSIKADRVELEFDPPADRSASPATAAAQRGATAQENQLRRVRAEGQVDVRSPEADILAQTLFMTVEDEPAPAASPVAQPAVQPVPSTPGPAEPRPAAPSPAPTSAPTPRRLQKQIVRGNEVRIVTVRDPGGNRLKHLTAIGDVHVTAATEAEPADIQGARLDLDQAAGTTAIRVQGRPARIEQGQLRIMGEVIDHDPDSGRAMVNGAGLVSFPADRDFQGRVLATPQRTEIRWTRQMLFEGPTGQFRGDVDAEQPGSRIWCDEMDIHMSADFSLRGRPARAFSSKDVERLDCRGQCQFLALDRPGELLSERHLLRAPRIVFDNRRRVVLAQGPGVYDWARRGQRPVSPAGATAPTAGSAPARPAGPGFGGLREATAAELGCTVVWFEESMESDLAADRSVFVGRVNTLYGNRPDTAAAPEVSRLLSRVPEGRARPMIGLSIGSEEVLPAGGMRLDAQRLEVRRRKVASPAASDQTTAYVEMEAVGNVEARSGAVYARGARLTFDQQKGQLVIAGHSEDYAVLWRRYQSHGPFDKVVAHKLFYYPGEDRLRTEQQQFLDFGEGGPGPR